MKACKGFVTAGRKKLFVALALSLLLSPFLSFADSHSIITDNNASPCFYAAQPLTDWIFDKTVSNVDCFHAIVVCNGKNVVLLKFENRNSTAVKIAWKELFGLQNGQSKDGFEGLKTLQIAPGITAPADCSDVLNNKLVLKGSSIDPVAVYEIFNFSFKDVTVTPV